MTTSDNGYNLIKESESLRLKTYSDSGGILTIGYGHTFGVKPNQVIIESIADDFLKNDVRGCEISLNKLGLNLNQNQYDACIDFIFNLGIGNFMNSTLYKKIKANPSDQAIEKEFKKWVYCKRAGKNVVLPGLVTRRNKEAELYFNKNGL